jgi:hypothetical protein
VIGFSSFLEFKLYYLPNQSNADVCEYLGMSRFWYVICDTIRDTERRRTEEKRNERP